MALVFKIKHQDTLRRWVVSESTDSGMFSVTLEQLEAKVRELFQLPSSALLAMTYIDKEDDVVTLGGDHDLVDAYLVQGLNPLRLEVQILGSKSNTSDGSKSNTSDGTPNEAPYNMNKETFLKSIFPEANTEALQGFLRRYAQLLDPTLPIATLIERAQEGFKDFLASATVPDHHRPAPSDPYKYPYVGMHSWSMPDRGDHTSPEDDSSYPTLHLGVQCDGCGMTPIQGIRYKSSKIPDFDLCYSCFQGKGSESDDYEKIEHPVFSHGHPHGQYLPPYLRRGVRGHPMGGRGLFARGPYGWKPERGFGGHPFNCCPAYDEHKKLDARFVKDVTIFDGTELAPGTKFTKIWRMSNIGSLPWPQNTQLLHIGGDVLSSQEAVNVELSEDGLACGEEVEVSVDLTAPDKPGRYISHWRLISPSSQKFGQRVWVTIHVVPQGEQSPMLQESLKDGAGINDGANVTFANPVQIIEVEDVTNNAKAKDEVMAMEGLVGPSSRDGSATSEHVVVENDINTDMEGFSLVKKPVEEEMMYNVDNMNTEKSSQELKLQSLESMGFTNRELNSVLLNKNQENMQRTLDDLLVTAGWNGAFQDLQEMGFTNQAANIQLLFKYNGSIKAVVRDLVRMEKKKA